MCDYDYLLFNLENLNYPIKHCLRFSVSVIKHHNLKRPWEERTYFSLEFSGHTPLLREVRAGIQIEQEPGGRS